MATKKTARSTKSSTTDGAKPRPAKAAAVKASKAKSPASPKSPAKPKAAPKAKVATKTTPSVSAIAAPAAAKKKAAKKAPEAPDPDAASKAVALACAEAALDKKAVNVVILDVRGKVDYADYLVVMSGKSDRQVQALARGIAEDVEQKTKTKCLSVEALPGSSWVLMDFGDVVVHVFYDDVRGYYDLESLWMDARRIPVPGGAEAN